MGHVPPPPPPPKDDKILVVDEEEKAVETLPEKLDIIEEVQSEVKKPEKVTPLPNIGDTFMLKGHEYKVVYINEGQNRFSCVPMKGVY